MRSIIAFMCFIALATAPKPLYSQQKVDTSLVYIHKEKASFKSRFFQKAASMLGAKNYIEKSIINNKYDQHAAPIPKRILKNYDVVKSTVQGRQIWTLRPKQHVSEAVIVYLHGGAYYWNISKHNWSFAEALLQKTNATIILPDYPLAPDSTCAQVYDYMGELYQELRLKYKPENISLIGESAGAGLALGFTMFLRDQNITQPKQLILLAPWLDVTMSNPDILQIDKKDKILGIGGLQLAGKGYVGELSPSDFRISPINGDLSDLSQISVFVGTHDLFAADSRKLRDKAHSIGVNLKYYEYPKMFHVWILVNKLKEAKHAQKQIASLILNSDQH